MGVITLSFKDEDELLLRQLAKNKFGKTKGALSKTVVTWIKEETSENKMKNSWSKVEKFLSSSSKNLGGKKPYESRSELYDRH